MSKILTAAMVAATALSLSACNQQEAVQEPVVATAPTEAWTPVEAPEASVSGIFQKYVVPVDIVAGGHCFLDAVNGGQKDGATAKTGQEVSFGGWVSDTNNQVPATAMFLIEGADGAYSLLMVAGAERPDVAAALANDALKNSGFNAAGKLEGVVPGEYKLGIVLADTVPTRCELNAKLLVTN